MTTDKQYNSRPRFLNEAPPVTVGQTIQVEIKDRGDKGDGIAFISGYVLFVKGGVIGEKVTVRVNKTYPRYSICEIIS